MARGGSVTAPSIETQVRVRYAETDAMGVAHHASYVVWLELGRVELLRARGVPYGAIEEAGFFVVLSELRVRYLAPARFDDLISVRATLAELRSRQIRFDYTLRLAATGERLVEASSEHIVVSRATGRPARLPGAILAALGEAGDARPA